MVDKLEERIEQIIDEKLGLYEPKTDRRRTANEIRDQIQEELEKRPKTTHELKNKLNASRNTIIKHCKHLVQINSAEKVTVEGQKYWSPAKTK